MRFETDLGVVTRIRHKRAYFWCISTHGVVLMTVAGVRVVTRLTDLTAKKSSVWS